MLKHMLALSIAVAAISLVAPEAGHAGGAACTPMCSLGSGYGHDQDRHHGLDRANEVAGEHGKRGRKNAEEKQEAHKKGGDDDVVVVVADTTSSTTSGTTSGTTDTTSSTTTTTTTTTSSTTTAPAPCDGC